ncbi:MAG TPA: transketolase C-terminal domain-containing protein [Anaerolineales bacterium]|nr:transketolase C-terminal domain-containing protein [Anaerolineales bacterium]
MVAIKLIPYEEFQRVRNAQIDKYQKLALIADMNRANTLAEVKRAGSGHLGSSFSAMDIVTWLYCEEMNILKVGFDNPNRDVYFSSKGHDVPGLYATLYSLGVLPEEKLVRLRRLGGLDGHPDVNIPGIEANSGSLGMGISKGRGMAWAKKHFGNGGQVYVLTGDGEWQEGQNYEALQSAVHQKIDNLTVIVDDNKVQSDKLVDEILSLGDLESKYRAFGWHVQRIDGHDYRQIEKALAEAKKIKGRPQIIIADTIKGRGISFMEHPAALEIGKGLYPWHSGAPDDVSYEKGYNELIERVNTSFKTLGLSPLNLRDIAPEEKRPPAAMLAGEPLSQAAQEKLSAKITDEFVVRAYGQALVEIAARRKDIVVLDADLSSDCKVRDFEYAYPERFIENGIAEQDMVSMAGGLAQGGLLPVVNSFASFLASRANEQIYNNASEKTKIIYALHYAGLIPAGPGKSHQSLRDISLFAALPNCTILQPCNADETRMVVEYSVEEAKENVALRFIIGPSPRKIQLPNDYKLAFGRGVALTEGKDAILFAYGPVMLHEALLAGELLAERGLGLKVINLPWLNRLDAKWLEETIKPYELVFVLEDHHPSGTLTDHILELLAASRNRPLASRRLIRFAVEGWPACGTPQEALKYHRLDGASLAERILEASD